VGEGGGRSRVGGEGRHGGVRGQGGTRRRRRAAAAVMGGGGKRKERVWRWRGGSGLALGCCWWLWRCGGLVLSWIVSCHWGGREGGVEHIEPEILFFFWPAEKSKSGWGTAVGAWVALGGQLVVVAETGVMGTRAPRDPLAVLPHFFHSPSLPQEKKKKTESKRKWVWVMNEWFWAQVATFCCCAKSHICTVASLCPIGRRRRRRRRIRSGQVGQRRKRRWEAGSPTVGSGEQTTVVHLHAVQDVAVFEGLKGFE